MLRDGREAGRGMTRDRRAERHLPPEPQGGVVLDARVAVVGGGIAGLAAATALAERGVSVVVFEKQTYLGGRVGSWTHRLPDGSTVSMSRGFHAFFRQYYNLRRLLARTDPGLERMTPVDDYPLLDRQGRLDSFRGLPTRPPWNALAFALRSPTFRLTDLIRLNARAALPLAKVRLPDVYHQLDDMTAAEFLDTVNFPPAARHLAFEVFSRSFFADPGDLSAAELAVMFHLYFLGSSEGLLFDVPDDSFDLALWRPLGVYLAALGTEIRTSTAITTIEPGGTRRFRLHTGTDDHVDADAVVLAADPAGLRTVVEQSPQLGPADWRTRIGRLPTAPPFLVHRLWLDRPLAPDRPAFLGTGGWDELDNISILDRYERGSQRWAQDHGGSVVELHAYAVATAGDDELTRRLVRLLHEVYPESREAGVIGAAVLRRADCPLFAPGTFTARPTVTTPVPGLVLAGDGIRIDLPVALMERAATTGLSAANHLLAQFGLTGHELWTVPNHGRFTLSEAK